MKVKQQQLLALRSKVKAHCFEFFWQRVDGAGPTQILLLFLLEEANHQAWSCHPVSMTLSCLKTRDEKYLPLR